jgi:hypothetical protein
MKLVSLSVICTALLASDAFAQPPRWILLDENESGERRLLANPDSFTRDADGVTSMRFAIVVNGRPAPMSAAINVRDCAVGMGRIALVEEHSTGERQHTYGWQEQGRRFFDTMAAAICEADKVYKQLNTEPRSPNRSF